MTTLQLTIPAGQSLSTPADCIGGTILRFSTPDAWDAAPITFQISFDNTGYLDVYHATETHEGLWSPYETGIMSVVPNSIVLLPPTAGGNLGWLKIRSGTRSQPIKQSSDRTFALMFG